MLVNLLRDIEPERASAWPSTGPSPPSATTWSRTTRATGPRPPTSSSPSSPWSATCSGPRSVVTLEVAGYEADDILATLATQGRDAGRDVVVVTGDRDAFQLVEDPHIKVMYTRKGLSDTVVYDEAGIEERTGVPPSSYAVLAALRGDPSDNLPGVPGVGEKTAAKLVTTYGDLDEIFAHAGRPDARSSAQNLAEHEDQVRRNAEVIPLVRDVAAGRSASTTWPSGSGTPTR